MPKPPWDETAELGVLGAILVDQSAVNIAAPILNDQDFFNPTNQALYKAVRSISDRGDIIDVVTLRSEMGENFDKIDGEKRIGQLEVLINTSRAIEEHCKIVAELSDRRKIMVLCGDVMELASSGEVNSMEMIAQIIHGSTKCSRREASLRWEKQILHEIIDDLEQHQGRDVNECQLDLAVPTGLASLDDMLTFGGLQRGIVTTIAAKTSQGKSSLVANIIRGAGKRQQKALCISLEDSAKSVVIRHLSQECGIDSRALQRRAVNSDEISSTQRAANDHLAAMEIGYIDEMPLSGVDELCAQIRAECLRYQFDILMVDFLQIIRSGKRFGNRQEEIDYIFMNFVTLARQLPNTATVLVSQLRRVDRRPKISDLYHSGMLEQGSRAIVLIWAPDSLDSNGIRVLDVAKQYNGPTGPVMVEWEPKYTLFKDLSPHRERDFLQMLDIAIQKDEK